MTSDDEGATWSEPVVLLQVPIKRPYWNVIDNGVDRVDIICTDGGNGGRELNFCSLFHFYIKAGRVYATDGTLVSRLSDLTSTGVSYSKLSKIYDVKENGAAWGWDVCLEPGTGYPVCVFAVFPSAVPANSDHRLYYGRWNGSSWGHWQITPAGRWIGTDGLEPRYSGGSAVNADDPSTVYLSRQRGGNPQGNAVFELELWKTSDKGRTWSMERSITQGSTDKNVRPIHPQRRRTVPGDKAPEVLWSAGRYTGFNQFVTRQLFYPPMQRPQVLARVKAPRLSSTEDTTLWMYYGNPAAVGSPGSAYDSHVILRYATWTDSSRAIYSISPPWRRWTCGVRNPAASKGGGSLDSDMEGGAFFIGANAGARSLVGRVEDVSVSNVRRPDAWIQTQAHDRVDLVRIGGAV